MTDQTTLTPEQIAAAEALTVNGRVADLDAAAAKAAKEAAKVDPDQAAIDAENERIELANKDTADKEAKDKAAEDKAAAASEDWKKDWVQTGNEHADAAIEMMKAAGVTPVEGNAVFAKAVESGDLNDVNWELLEARVGKATAKLVRTGVEQYFNTEVTAQKQTTEFAYKLVGGEKEWDALKTWANKSTDPSVTKAVETARSAIKQGGGLAELAITQLHGLYNADPKNTTTGQNGQLTRGGRPGTSTDVAPLSATEYFLAMEKAGGDRAPETVKAALRAQRAAGRAAGR